ncbi:MAG TPA: dynamin family protein [Acidiferrobacteraceae bacterium]|nr:dynamin family protein [Acidiferrobacteraceae bacterium]
MMHRIEVQFNAYSAWRERLSAAIEALRGWLQGQDLSETQVDQRLQQVLATLHDDKLYIAFVAEFSRGKSELINAVFFSGFGQRVLPSSAGRTTMCPTELFYDPEVRPCLRLLPIETRTTATTIAEYKGSPEEWTTIPLDTALPDQMAEALAQIALVKPVPLEAARSFGLHVAESEGQVGVPLRADGLVEVPQWRHAMINLPHPLLEQGLVILDTPGLNALGAEPELTLSMLPSAHAILFILAADTGVTKSDIQMWQDHIQGGVRAPDPRQSGTKGRLVVLNKIDGLWDELKEPAAIDREIERQVAETARHLGLSTGAIFPVSAQKALLGKIKGDREIIARSRIGALEDAIGRELLPEKQAIVAGNIIGDMDEIQKSIAGVLDQRLRGVHEHMDELSGLNGKNMDVIEHMMEKVKIDKEHFEKSLQRFQATRSILSQQMNQLYEELDLRALDKMTARIKKDMEISLTTAGIRAGMGTFFEQAEQTMHRVAAQSAEIKTLMDGVYRKFQEEHGLTDVKPAGFSVMKYVREIRRFRAKHEQAMVTLVLTEQKVAVRKFFSSAVARVRAIFALANRDAEVWLKNIMSPMESQVREHQTQLRRRLESIKRIYKASSTLEDRLNELRHVEEGLNTQRQEIQQRFQEILQTLTTPVSAEPEALRA